MKSIRRDETYACQLIVTRVGESVEVKTNGFPLSCLNIGIKAVIDISSALGIDNNLLLILIEKSLKAAS